MDPESHSADKAFMRLTCATGKRWKIINGPFDTAAHTVDVRHVATGEGKYNIQNIGIFLWRLGAYPLTKSPAFQLDAHRFLFHPLGFGTQLFTNPVT